MPTRPIRSYGTNSANAPLAPFEIQRREPGAPDVEIEILFCGVCHSDLHQARNEWHNTVYPCVPGHEIVGRVTRVGSGVTAFKPGDVAAVGCMVDSCRNCVNCKAGNEVYCLSFPVLTYNGTDKALGGMTTAATPPAWSWTRRSCCACRRASTSAAAPLLCAGITTYSPLRHWKVGPGQKVGVVGLGGLGHMGVKLARAMGAHVVLFTTSPGKVADGLRLGAHEVVVSKNENLMKQHAGSLDFVLDAVSAQHDINALLALLKLDGTLCLVGAPEHPLPVSAFQLILPRRNFAGSDIGGMRETQEMLDFCAHHGIVSDMETIRSRRSTKPTSAC